MQQIDLTGRVVVGIDGTGGSENTLNWAAATALRHGRGLTLAMAYPQASLPTAWRSMKTGRVTSSMKKQQSRADAELSRILELTKSQYPGLDVTEIHGSQDAAGLLVEASKTADLVVVGSAPIQGIRGAALGGVTDSVMMHAKSSVAVIPKDMSLKPKGNVVVGVDESTDAQLSLKCALREAHLSGVDLEMITAWQIPTSLSDGSPTGIGSEEIALIEQDSMALLTRYLHEVAADFPDVKVVKKVVCETAAAALVEASVNASTVFVGGRGSGGFAGLLLGSTSRLLSRQSSCPVIVVRNRSLFNQ